MNQSHILFTAEAIPSAEAAAHSVSIGPSLTSPYPEDDESPVQLC